jgi:undecaprenyl-diphosphatase
VVRQLIHLDGALRLWVVTHRVGALNPVMWAVSVIGRNGIVWMAAGTVLAIARRISRSSLLHMVLAIVLSLLVTDHVLKPLIGRERPFAATPTIHVIGGRPGDASFPSGHATSAFAGAYVLSWTVPAGRFVWWAMALAIAYSRVYLGVHYPIDVIGGAIVGWLCGLFVRRVASRQRTLPESGNRRIRS